MKSSIWKIKFDGINASSLWRQILWVSFYDYDETPYALSITILGFEFDFLIGKWVEE